VKKAIIILLILLFGLFYYSGFLTKKETLPLSKEFFSVESLSNIDRTWTLKKKSPPDKKELDQIYQLKLEKGVKNLPIISFLLIRESEKARINGDPDLAIELSLYSIKFSPDLYYPYFELARAYWNKNPLKFYLTIFSALQGLKAKVNYFSEAIKFYYNILYIISNAILMTFIIFGIIILIKYIPLYFYDIRKNLSNEISKILINSLKIFILLIPFLIRLNILWAIIFWNILLWGFISGKERKLIVIFLILLVYIPFVLRSSSAFLSTEHSEVILGIHQANYEGYDGFIEKKLKNWISTHPEDSDVLFSLGLIEKRQGHYSQAEEFYKKAIQYNPQMDEAYSNLGNIYLIQKLTDTAISCYEKAIQINPHKGVYYYNLYKAYSQETFISTKIDKAFKKARELDSKLVDFYSRIDSPQINRLGIDEIITSKRLWDKLFSQFIGREGFLFYLFKAWFEKIPSRINFLIPLVFLGLLIIISRYIRTKKFLTRCPMCGSPTYRFYLGTSEDEFICFNCYRIFIQKEKLHPRIMEKKTLQVKDFQRKERWIGRFISFFICGFDYLWRGQFLKGILILFVFFIFLIKFVYFNGVILPSFGLPTPIYWRMLWWVGLFIIFYIFVLLKIIRTRPKERSKS